MKKSVKQLVLVVLCLLILISCGPTVEKELKRWDFFNESIKNAALVYPAFAEPLNTQLAIWSKEWILVQDVEDEKEKAKAMDKFLDSITWITKNISKYERYQKEIHKLPIDITDKLRKNSGKYPELKKYDAMLLIAEKKGINAVGNAVNIILTATPGTYEEASGAFRDAVKVLELGREDLEEIDDEIQSFLNMKAEAEAEAKKDN